MTAPAELRCSGDPPLCFSLRFIYLRVTDRWFTPLKAVLARDGPDGSRKELHLVLPQGRRGPSLVLPHSTKPREPSCNLPPGCSAGPSSCHSSSEPPKDQGLGPGRQVLASPTPRVQGGLQWDVAGGAIVETPTSHVGSGSGPGCPTSDPARSQGSQRSSRGWPTSLDSWPLASTWLSPGP